MKKQALPIILALAVGALAGCSGSQASSSASSETAETTAQAAASKASDETSAQTSAPDASQDASQASSPSGSETAVRVGSLKGPTSMGLVSLMDLCDQGKPEGSYEFTMVTAADELLGNMVSGNLDIALIPANTASVLYNKTNGQISVIDINTLGVLYLVSADDSIQSIADLKGKTVYMTGKGTTPEYVFRYLLSQNGLGDGDLTIEFKSEAAEVAAILKEQPEAVGLLPQPFVTSACAQNESLKIVLDLTKEWDALQGEGGSQLVTGVTVVRTPFLEENQAAVETFLKEHQASAAYANEHPAEAAQLIAGLGIIEKAAIAEKALPYCNITCITGEDMKTALSGYLQVLYDQDPASVGGALPGDDFYFIGQ